MVRPTFQIKRRFFMNNLGRFQCIHGTDITERYFKHCLEIDKQVYPEIYQGNLALCSAWFEKNPFIYTLIIDTTTDTAVGYINAMPITTMLHDMIMKGQSMDTEISPDQHLLSYENDTAYHLYLCSLAVAPEYQKTVVFPLLFNAFLGNLHQLTERGIQIKQMIAEAVSKEGISFCERNQFEKVMETENHTVLYRLDAPLSTLKPLHITK